MVVERSLAGEKSRKIDKTREARPVNGRGQRRRSDSWGIVERNRIFEGSRRYGHRDIFGWEG